MTTALSINTRPNSLPAYSYAGHLESVLGAGAVRSRSFGFWEGFGVVVITTFIVLLEILTA